MEKVSVCDLNDIHNKSRFNKVKDYFVSKFQENPSFFVKCPGRVNLIGEHIDYSGFAVLPMAIEKDVLIAVGINNKNKLTILNVEEKYLPFSSSPENILIGEGKPNWYDYVLCGYKGIAEKCTLEHTSLNLVVSGNIPPSSGLSSSSALVCAGALATSYLNGYILKKTEIADLCAASERFIGTQGGGMDQAIIFLAEKGIAKKIDFNPLRTTDVPLPDKVRFIVAHSGVYMNKAASCIFNKRVAECCLAAKILAKSRSLDWRSVNKLGDIPVLLNKTPNDLLKVIQEAFIRDSYSRTEICEVLGIQASELKAILEKFSLSSDFESFSIAPRARHVFQEATNVDAFINSCRENNLEEIGGLLTSSHNSLKTFYECSHEKLNLLVDFAIKHGALGARLTGAGWGGCIIAAVREDRSKELVEKMKAYAIKQGLDSESVFLTSPSDGAVIYLP